MKTILLSTVVLMLATAGAAAQETPRMGGVLKVAAIGEPPTLDIQATTTVLTYEIMWHVYEPLFTHDRAWNPIPMLAESDAVSDRGLRHTITLRRADAEGTLHVYQYADKGVVVEEPTAGPELLFYPSGRSATPTTIRVRDSQGRESTFTVSITGRVSVS